MLHRPHATAPLDGSGCSAGRELLRLERVGRPRATSPPPASCSAPPSTTLSSLVPATTLHCSRTMAIAVDTVEAQQHVPAEGHALTAVPRRVGLRQPRLGVPCVTLGSCASRPQPERVTHQTPCRAHGAAVAPVTPASPQCPRGRRPGPAMLPPPIWPTLVVLWPGAGAALQPPHLARAHGWCRRPGAGRQQDRGAPPLDQVAIRRAIASSPAVGGEGEEIEEMRSTSAFVRPASLRSHRFRPLLSALADRLVAPPNSRGEGARGRW